MPIKSKQISFSLNENVYKELREMAAAGHTSILNIIRSVLIEFVEDTEDIREGLKSLESTAGTISFCEYKQKRAERERAGI
jgi:hypothetical protein